MRRWRLKDFHSFSKSQSEPSNRSTASLFLTHSWERIAPPLSPTQLCKYHCHHNALQLCVDITWALSMPNTCGSVWLWGHDYRCTGSQKHPKRKPLFFNLSLKNKGGGGSNSKYPVTFVYPLLTSPQFLPHSSHSSPSSYSSSFPASRVMFLSLLISSLSLNSPY